METPGSIVAERKVKTPLRERILNCVLRCSHRNQGRLITLKGETFAICRDCGRHVAYDIRPLIPAKSDGRALAAQPPKTGSRGFLGACLGLLAIGLGGGIYYSASRSPAAEKRAASHPAPATALPQPEPSPAHSTANPPAMWTVIVPPRSEVTKTAALRPPTVPKSSGPKLSARLEGDGGFVQLTKKESAAVELSRHAGRMGQLIRSGSLFNVSRGTAIRILQRKQHVVHVVITEGSRAGQEGWVPASQLKQ